jgi:hypothetical protein
MSLFGSWVKAGSFAAVAAGAACSGSARDAAAAAMVNAAGVAITSPDGGFTAQLLAGPAQNGVATLVPVIGDGRVEVYRDDVAYSTRHGVAILWQAAEGPVLWIRSGDVGTFRVVRDNGAWRKEASTAMPDDVRRRLTR